MSALFYRHATCRQCQQLLNRKNIILNCFADDDGLFEKPVGQTHFSHRWFSGGSGSFHIFVPFLVQANMFCHSESSWTASCTTGALLITNRNNWWLMDGVEENLKFLDIQENNWSTIGVGHRLRRSSASNVNFFVIYLTCGVSFRNLGGGYIIWWM